jgi:hypothetical protein
MLKTKGNQLFHNLKTTWIYMLSSTKRVLEEHKPLVVRKNDDFHVILITKTTIELLCDVEVVMGFTCIMTLLEVVYEVIKFAQSCNTFVCDFVEAMNMCCAYFYSLYCDLKKRYIDL